MPDHRRDCPNCQQRVHPLELSDLYRGRRLNCLHCGRGLSAEVAWWAALPIGMLAWWMMVSLGGALEAPFWVGVLLGMVFAWMAAFLVRAGLVIEGAPWVSLSAREKAWKPQQQSWVRSLFSTN